MKTILVGLCIWAGFGVCQGAEDRAEKVRGDKARVSADATWIYNDLNRAVAEAKRTNKPLFVVLRCIPCEACSKFDKKLLERENLVRDLFDKFVNVRIVQANGLDLSLFQFDYDQSFHAFFLSPDKTIYGRFGTRSARDEDADMTMAGLRKAMLGALELHANYPSNKETLAGKQAKPTPYTVPEELPSLKGKYGSKLDYEGKVVQSCIHCHQVRDAERSIYRDAKKLIPDAVLFPYPLPDVLGLTMDPDERAKVTEVAAESIAAKSGIKAGDTLLTAGGQPLLSTADLQWALHHAPATAALKVEIDREGQKVRTELVLPSGWRTTGDISWRPTTWHLRALVTGGLLLEEISDEERREMKLPASKLALRAKHVGEYGEHAAAKNAGFRKGDILVSMDGEDRRRTESQFIAAAQRKARGEKIDVVVLREGEKVRLKLPMQ